MNSPQLIISTVFILFFNSAFICQNEVYATQNNGFEQVFGTSPLYTISVDTVHETGKPTIIVKDDCTVTAVNENGQEIWTLNTKKYGCTYISYGFLEQEINWGSNTADFFIQSKKNKLYLMNSSTGKKMRIRHRKQRELLSLYQ